MRGEGYLLESPLVYMTCSDLWRSPSHKGLRVPVADLQLSDMELLSKWVIHNQAGRPSAEERVVALRILPMPILSMVLPPLTLGEDSCG